MAETYLPPHLRKQNTTAKSRDVEPRVQPTGSRGGSDSAGTRTGGSGYMPRTNRYVSRLTPSAKPTKISLKGTDFPALGGEVNLSSPPKGHEVLSSPPKECDVPPSPPKGWVDVVKKAIVEENKQREKERQLSLEKEKEEKKKRDEEERKKTETEKNKLKQGFIPLPIRSRKHYDDDDDGSVPQWEQVYDDYGCPIDGDEDGYDDENNCGYGDECDEEDGYN